MTVFEALHELGGVLVYGIPEFRLPKQKIVAKEIEKVKELGVKFETNVVIGKSTTIDQLMEEEGFEAVFIGSGAGLPMFMGIPGENANEVFSAIRKSTCQILQRFYLCMRNKDGYDLTNRLSRNCNSSAHAMCKTQCVRNVADGRRSQGKEGLWIR